MRIAIVTETWPPEINGVALTVHSLARGLRQLGHDVELIRLARPEDDAAEYADGFPETLLPGASLPRYPGLRFGLPARSRLLRHWQSSRPDAIYIATEGPLGHSALTASRKLGVPACTGFHTRFDDFVAHYGFAWLTPLVFAGMRRFHNRADATLVPTAELADFLRERGFRDVRLLRRAVDTSLFHPSRRDDALRREWGLDPDALTVIHVGRLAAEKNLDLAVRAFRAIQQDTPNARFVIVGDGPERARLESANPDIVFTGIRRGDDLARHYASADLFVFPSTSETFGNVTLEAMASGLAVVAFDYGAAHEHIVSGDCGRCVPVAEETEFIRATTDLANQEARRTDMRIAARDAVVNLNPDAVSASFSDVLDSLRMERAA